MRSFRLNQLGPKSSDKYPYKKQRKRHRHWRDSQVQMEAEIALMQSKAKECLEPQKPEEASNAILLP